MRELETFYLLYDVGWYVYMTAEPLNEHELRETIADMCKPLEHHLSFKADYENMPLDELFVILGFCYDYAVLEICKLWR